jgi:hypothetical protein
MTGSGLRHYIPVGALARREPLVGDEPFLRLSRGFVPRWYHDRLGIDFSERWHTDPVRRYESVLTMRQYLHETFPTVPEFQPRWRDGVEARCSRTRGEPCCLVRSPCCRRASLRFTP